MPLLDGLLGVVANGLIGVVAGAAVLSGVNYLGRLRGSPA
jgi:hypothetical protein